MGKIKRLLFFIIRLESILAFFKTVSICLFDESKNEFENKYIKYKDT